MKPREILAREPVREAVDEWLGLLGMRVPWFEAILNDTLSVWMRMGARALEVPGAATWIVEPHVLEEPPESTAALDKLEATITRRDVYGAETRKQFLARAAARFDAETEILRKFSGKDALLMKSQGVSRLDRLRMVAHRRIGRLSPEAAWRLVCLDERFSDEEGLLPPAQGRPDYRTQVGLQQKVSRLCRDVEKHLDLIAPLRLVRSPPLANT